MIRLPPQRRMKEMFGGSRKPRVHRCILVEPRVQAGLDAFSLATVARIPETTARDGETKEKQQGQPTINTLMYRRFLSKHQPCAACDSPLHVDAPNVVLPCAHIVHTDCAEFLQLKGVCFHCSKIEKRSPIEQLCVYLCCLQSYQ